MSDDEEKRGKGRPLNSSYMFGPEHRRYSDAVYRERNKHPLPPWRPSLATLGEAIGADGKVIKHRVDVDVLSCRADALQVGAAAKGEKLSRRAALRGAILAELESRKMDAGFADLRLVLSVQTTERERRKKG